MRNLILMAAVVCSFAQPAAAQVKYSISDLGYLPGGVDTTAVGINNLGHIVGMAADANLRSVAFWYTGSMVSLGTLGGTTSKANGINDSDRIVGWAYTAAGVAHAFVYDAGSANPQMVDLHPLVGFGGRESRATSVNNNGQIVGITTMPGGNFHAFLLDGSTAQDLHSLVSFGGVESQPYGITDNGLIVGASSDAAGHLIAFLYNLNTSTLTNLGTLGGAQSGATAVNGSGTAVGFSEIAAGDSVGFQALPGTTLSAASSLGALGGTASAAFGINTAGQIVGSAEDAAGGSHAFFYSAGTGMRDLESLTPGISGWVLAYGTAINDSGTITGVGVHNGNSTSFLLQPLGCQDITSQVTVKRGGFVLNHKLNKFVQTVQVVSADPSLNLANGTLVLTNLSANATLANAPSSVCQPSPAAPNTGLSFNNASPQAASLTLQFSNPTNAGITYGVQVLVP